MRLSYLAYLHHLIFVAAIIAAVFLGMVMEFKLRQAEQYGEELGMMKAYIAMPLVALTEVATR